MAEFHAEEDYLFLKRQICPICDNEFKSLAVRTGKPRSLGQDDDLRPKFSGIDPLKYEVVMCSSCGYAAVSRYFNDLLPIQVLRFSNNIKSTIHGVQVQISDSGYSYDDAMERYKTALKCDETAGAISSRKAYTYLKFAWLIRGKLENEKDDISEEDYVLLQKKELRFLANAYRLYNEAFSTEQFPMSGMDEPTLAYLTAQLAFRLGKYREALQTLTVIFANRQVNPRIKDKASDLKDAIRKKIKEQQEAESN